MATAAAAAGGDVDADDDDDRWDDKNALPSTGGCVSPKCTFTPPPRGPDRLNWRQKNGEIAAQRRYAIMRA